ncbi:MAG TPA: hypothetical protein VFH66_13760 [Mycobacteriales bacterium]|nr:hypothetical protein [Mycobacteriales bacterium]
MRTSRLHRVVRCAAVATLMTGLVTVSGVGTASAAPSIQAQLAQVRAATAAFHSIPAAEAAGYVKFLDCFDSAEFGGMGQHWLLPGALAKPLDPASPAALVYEPRADGSYQLVAVEYVVPDPEKTLENNKPELLGQQFTYLDALGVWKLHAWIWRPNPAGMFKDFNRNVNMCP